MKIEYAGDTYSCNDADDLSALQKGATLIAAAAFGFAGAIYGRLTERGEYEEKFRTFNDGGGLGTWEKGMFGKTYWKPTPLEEDALDAAIEKYVQDNCPFDPMSETVLTYAGTGAATGGVLTAGLIWAGNKKGEE